MPVHEKASTKSTRTDLGPLPNCTLDQYFREGAGVTNVKRFDAMTVDGWCLVIYDRSCFERDTFLDAWRRCWAVLSRKGVGISVDSRFANMSFVWCEQSCPIVAGCETLLSVT